MAKTWDIDMAFANSLMDIHIFMANEATLGIYMSNHSSESKDSTYIKSNDIFHQVGQIEPSERKHQKRLLLPKSRQFFPSTFASIFPFPGIPFYSKQYGPMRDKESAIWQSKFQTWRPAQRICAPLMLIYARLGLSRTAHRGIPTNKKLCLPLVQSHIGQK